MLFNDPIFQFDSSSSSISALNTDRFCVAEKDIYRRHDHTVIHGLLDSTIVIIVARCVVVHLAIVGKVDAPAACAEHRVPRDPVAHRYDHLILVIGRVSRVIESYCGPGHITQRRCARSVNHLVLLIVKSPDDISLTRSHESAHVAI